MKLATDAGLLSADGLTVATITESQGAFKIILVGAKFILQE